MRILIVDDNAAMRKVLAALFESQGHQVVGTLPDGAGVEEMVRRTAPDLVCLDYHLPGRDGLSILQALQAISPELDVVFMTASSESGIEGKAADAGASGFIRKPFGQEQIIAELKAVAETRRLEKAAARRVSQAVPAHRRRHGTAVIADDNGSVRLVLKALLEECGLQVVQMVANGQEAVNAARNHKPRVFCLDVHMPLVGGLEALPQILEISPETLVVMVNGEVEKTMVAQAAGLGAVGYIVKPLRPAYVEGFFRKLLG